MLADADDPSREALCREGVRAELDPRAEAALVAALEVAVEVAGEPASTGGARRQAPLLHWWDTGQSAGTVQRTSQAGQATPPAAARATPAKP